MPCCGYMFDLCADALYLHHRERLQQQPSVRDQEPGGDCPLTTTITRVLPVPSFALQSGCTSCPKPPGMATYLHAVVSRKRARTDFEKAIAEGRHEDAVARAREQEACEVITITLCVRSSCSGDASDAQQTRRIGASPVAS